MANQHDKATPAEIERQQQWLKHLSRKVSFTPAAKVGLKDLAGLYPERETPLGYSEWIQSLIEIDSDTANFLGIALDLWMTSRDNAA